MTTPYQPEIIQSISEVHRMLGLSKPGHPLVSLINLADIQNLAETYHRKLVLGFYNILIKKNCQAKLKYGQNYYDFDEGVMTFIAPGQVVSVDADETVQMEGWWLLFHPDLIQSSPLAKTIQQHGYFSYNVTEALHLSEKEEIMIQNLLHQIEQEYQSGIDNFSHSVIVSQIDLLLNYCNRFYHRQFITRQKASNDLLAKFETMLEQYFESSNLNEKGLPTVQYFAANLNLSPGYLSDLLRNLTGLNTQQHIHNQIINKAKEILITTSLSVSEIAYLLGFEHSQSFNKLFKNKTKLSPLEFRSSFN